MLIVGKREAEAGKVSLRRRHEGDKGAVSVDEFLRLAGEEISNKA